MGVPIAENKKITGFVVLWQSDERGFTLARLPEVVQKFLIIVIVLAILVANLITSGLSHPASVLSTLKIFMFESLKILPESLVAFIVFYFVSCWAQLGRIPTIHRELN
jgi:hypothetical protein